MYTKQVSLVNCRTAWNTARINVSDSYQWRSCQLGRRSSPIWREQDAKGNDCAVHFIQGESFVILRCDSVRADWHFMAEGPGPTE